MPDNDQDNQPLHGPNLILDVENFGPIAEARNVEFRPMTVFVGPSNTGKSYLAMLLHAMLQGMPKGRRDSLYWRFGRRAHDESPIDVHAVVTEMANWKRRSPQRVGAIDDSRLIEVPVRELTDEVRMTMRRLSTMVVNQLSVSIRQSIREYFEVTGDDELVLKQSASTESPSVDLRMSSGQSHPNRSIGIYTDANEYEILDFEMPVLALDSLDRIRDDDALEHVSSFVLDCVANSTVKKSFPTIESSYLPASRTGIMTSHATLTDRIIANAGRISIEGSELVPFHRIPAEFLRAINAVGRSRRIRRGFPRAARTMAGYLESELLGGKIDVERGSIGLPQFYYERHEIRYPLFRSSSMITELAPLVLYLRNYMSIGDLMIVEEPESHLHPAAQQRLAGILTLMIRSGFRILITTHSDYFVEQLGVFRNASYLDAHTRGETLQCFGRSELDSDLYLRGDEIGVYGFGESTDGTGTTVEELLFDEDEWEYGSRDHTDAVIEQFNRNSRVMAARAAQP